MLFREKLNQRIESLGLTAYDVAKNQDKFHSGTVRTFLYGTRDKCSSAMIEFLFEKLGLVVVPVEVFGELHQYAEATIVHKAKVSKKITSKLEHYFATGEHPDRKAVLKATGGADDVKESDG